MRKLFLPLIAALALAAVAFPATALASPPVNDDFVNATAISSLPFSDSVGILDAGYEAGESGYCGVSNTVWYSFTASSDATLRINLTGSNFYGPDVNVYRQDGSGIGGLSFLSCSYSGGQMLANVQAGETYYLQAGSSYWGPGGGNLHITVDVVPPPPNDDFGNATVVPSLPFSDTVDTTAGGNEFGEPLPSCAYTGLPAGSVWYAFTPSVSGSVSARAPYNAFATVLAAYTGGSLNSLSEIGCRNWGGLLTFHVEAGTTYYFQSGGLYGGKGTLQFTLAVAPQPVASFGYSPPDPSIFDTVQFYDQSNDPGEVGFASQAWDFGDGSTGDGCCPTHHYAADGDYTVQLTVTTIDGRTASTSQTVHVQTHDVAIAKLTVPQSAKSGQTRQITVGVSNHRYPENVQVDLYSSGPGGGIWVGSLSQSVPVRGGGRTTDYSFSYTFTAGDAAAGKVTFSAVATIVNARDALPVDNIAIALPTKVTG